MKINRESARGRGNYGWLKANYSFSFSNFYNPKKMGYESLKVINEDFIAPSSGFPTHGHKNMEILTIVLKGTLGHTDSLGNTQTLTPGKLQRMYAGTGIQHSEFNNSQDEELNLLQIWIEPNQLDLPPEYIEKDFDLLKNQEIILASDTGENGSIKIYQKMEVSYLHLDEKQSTNIEVDKKIYLHVISGEVKINEDILRYGDSLEGNPTKSILIEPQKESKILCFKFK